MNIMELIWSGRAALMLVAVLLPPLPGFTECQGCGGRGEFSEESHIYSFASSVNSRSSRFYLHDRLEAWKNAPNQKD